MAQSTAYDLYVYQPRNPKASAYYKCVENYFEELEQMWDDTMPKISKNLITFAPFK